MLIQFFLIHHSSSVIIRSEPGPHLFPVFSELRRSLPGTSLVAAPHVVFMGHRLVAFLAPGMVFIEIVNVFC
jgi:hypothetical protein